MADIRVIRREDREVSDADATSGIVREQAISDEGLWGGFVRVAPDRPSGWHHHGDYDTYIYLISGSVRMEFGPGGSNVIEAGPGDFVHVPKELIHREVNFGDEEGGVVLFRVGSGPPVVNVEGPELAG